MEWIDDILPFPIEHLPFIFLVLLIAFTFHEFSHAYAAYKFGDPTAKDAGRVTLNPRVHLDVFGTILILLAGFGWAKPVPVDRRHFSKPRIMGIIVSFVGPLSNLVIAITGLILYLILHNTGLVHGANAGVESAISVFFYYLIRLNFLLFIFNLLPLPPLDGYRIIEDLAPTRVRIRMHQNEQWGIVIFLLLVFIPPLRAVTLDPVLGLAIDLNLFFGNIIFGLLG